MNHVQAPTQLLIVEKLGGDLGTKLMHEYITENQIVVPVLSVRI